MQNKILIILPLIKRKTKQKKIQRVNYNINR